MSFTKDRSVYINSRVYHVHEFYTNADYSAKIRKLTRTRTGESNPHWLEQIRNEQNATTLMSGTFHTFERQHGTSWFVTKNPNDPNDKRLYRQDSSGDFAGYTISMPSKPAQSLDVAYNRCLINHLKNVRSVQVSFSTPTFLGELREAVHMLRHPAEALRRNLIDPYVAAVKKRKHKKPKSWQKGLSGMWLEYAFGWVPFMSDINKAYDTYMDLYLSRHRGRDYQWVRGFGAEDMDFPADSAYQYPTNVAVLSNQGKGYISYRYTQRAIVILRSLVVARATADSTLSKRAQRFGFDPLEFVPTAWELLPWSFLVDYFSNIGDVIQASVVDKSNVNFTNRTDLLLKTKEQQHGWEEKACKAAYPGYLYGGGTASTAKLQYREVTRTPNVALGWPSLSLELPGRPAQWANMTALWVQVNNGIFPQRFRGLSARGLQKNL